MINSMTKYKRIIWALSITIVILLLSNYAALRKLDLAIRAPAEKIEAIEEPSFKDSVVSVVTEKANTIVLVIDDFGYRNDAISNGFLNLPAPITCAVLPGHSNSSRIAKKAIKAGKEVIIHMPMQSSVASSGEDGFKLKTGMTSEEIEWRLSEALSEIPEAVGINNHQGSKATSDSLLMNHLGSVLKKRNKFFIDSRTTSETVAEKTISSLNVSTTRRDIFLDNELDSAKITKQFMSLVNIAERDGSAIGIGHIKVETLDVLREQIPLIKEQGFKFEFVSKMLD